MHTICREKVLQHAPEHSRGANSGTVLKSAHVLHDVHYQHCTSGLSSAGIGSGTAVLHAMWINICKCSCKAASVTGEHNTPHCWSVSTVTFVRQSATSPKTGLQTTQPPQKSADSSGTLLAPNKEDSITCCKTWIIQERPQQSWSNTAPQNLSMPTQAFRNLFLMLYSQSNKQD